MSLARTKLQNALTSFFNSEILAVYRSWANAFSRSDLVLGIVLFAIGVVVAYYFVKYERGKEKTEKL